MHNPIRKAMTVSALLAGGLLVAACGGADSAADETIVNALESDPMYEAGNDITAVDGGTGNAAGPDGNGIDAALENAAEASQNAAEEIGNAQDAAN